MKIPWMLNALITRWIDNLMYFLYKVVILKGKDVDDILNVSNQSSYVTVNVKDNTQSKEYDKINYLINMIKSIVTDFYFSKIDSSTVAKINGDIRAFIDKYNETHTENRFIIIYKDITLEDFEDSSLRFDMSKHIDIKFKDTGKVVSIVEYINYIY